MIQNADILGKMTYLAGNCDIVSHMGDMPAKTPFSDDVCGYLSAVSDRLRKDDRSRQYPDVVTFGFWIRRASLNRLKERFLSDDEFIRLGSGVAFHIAPSNVPVNFAYSMVAGLLAGNANVVRVPSKEFEQVEIISEAFRAALEEYESMKPYVVLVRYGRDKAVNDYLSFICDVRVIWGGDGTIEELRKSPLPPRGTEITFADRYSIAVIDADVYLRIEDRDRVANDFYNDTYLTDQNACTSPRAVIWLGDQKAEAKEEFWERLYQVVKKKYRYQDIMGVNKLTSAYLAAAGYGDDSIRIKAYKDNLLVRVSVGHLEACLMDYRDNSGYFYEYDCGDVTELYDICNDKHCQTIGLIGELECVRPLIEAGVKGVDRVVPIGKTMDFDLIWDGYDLIGRMCRQVAI